MRRFLKVLGILRKLVPARNLISRSMPVVGVAAVAVIGFMGGRMWRSTGHSQEFNNGPRQTQASNTAYDKRVVAYIYDTIPITREELGEFLIARFGAERLEFLVNRKIVELACRARGIEITDEVIERQLDLDLKAMPNMNRTDFQNQVLKRFNKTLYEWKEDVIRPKLMLASLVGREVTVTEDELLKGFEGRYGEKVDCRWIVLQDKNEKYSVWEQAKKSGADFDRCARQYNIVPKLAGDGGKAPPIHKYFGDDNIEKAAFNLKPGEVSSIIAMQGQTAVILKCDRHIPRDTTKRFEVERLTLMEEIRNAKLSQRISDTMEKLRKEANARLLLRNETHQEELERTVRSELSGQAPKAPAVNRTGG